MQPLLLSSTNGGHAFRALPVPPDALMAAGAEELSLIDIAFGGKGAQTGAVLCRYGKGRGLLLVSADSGAEWACVDPQAWFVHESERKRAEKEAAARAKEAAAAVDPAPGPDGGAG